eukprot:UN4550
MRALPRSCKQRASQMPATWFQQWPQQRCARSRPRAPIRSCSPGTSRLPEVAVVAVAEAESCTSVTMASNMELQPGGFMDA